MTTITPLLRVKERIVGPSGYFNIQNEWYGYADEFKYTIGLAGLMGFGVGCCPPELLPPDMALLPGTEDRFSPNYGTYIHVPSASIQCFIPSHYMDVQAVGDTNAPFYGTKVVISNTQSGDAVLPKAFQNNGSNLAGVFIDKYQGSNCKPDGSGQANHSDGIGGTPLTGGIFASRPLHWPVSAVDINNGGTSFNSPFSLCNSDALNAAITDSPSDNLGGVWQLCKTRGAAFAPLPIWVRGQVAFLSLAHAQALLDTSGVPIAGATNNAAWMDVVPYAPKGNNSGGADTNKTSLQFARTDLLHSGSINASGYAGRGNRAFTGAARISGVAAVEHTTHNGQLSGIVDIGHNQWDTCPGLTTVGTGAGDFRLFPASADWTATSSNTSITGAAGVISLAAETAPGDDDGVWWAAGNVNNFLVGHADGTFHPSSAFADATLQAMTECILPRELGTSLTQTGTNIYGGDRFLSARVNNLLPLVGGDWDSGASAGVFGVILSGTAASDSSNSVVRVPSAFCPRERTCWGGGSLPLPQGGALLAYREALQGPVPLPRRAHAQHAALREVRALGQDAGDWLPVPGAGHRGQQEAAQKDRPHPLQRAARTSAPAAEPSGGGQVHRAQTPQDCVRKAGRSWQTARRLATLRTQGGFLKCCCRMSVVTGTTALTLVFLGSISTTLLPTTTTTMVRVPSDFDTITPSVDPQGGQPCRVEGRESVHEFNLNSK
jgi:hypothetical protein